MISLKTQPRSYKTFRTQYKTQSCSLVYFWCTDKQKTHTIVLPAPLGPTMRTELLSPWTAVRLKSSSKCLNTHTGFMLETKRNTCAVVCLVGQCEWTHRYCDSRPTGCSGSLWWQSLSRRMFWAWRKNSEKLSRTIQIFQKTFQKYTTIQKVRVTYSFFILF